MKAAQYLNHIPIPNAEQAVVTREKVRNYLLNLHPDGGSKAIWFHSLGYVRDEWQLLADDLLTIARNCDEFGIKYKVSGLVGRPDHRPGTVMTVWIVDDGNAPRIVTAYPDEET